MAPLKQTIARSQLLFLSLFLFFTGSKAITYINPDSNCDVITLKNGKLIYCKIKSIKHSRIEYTECSNVNSLSVSINTDSAFMVNYSNGKSEILNSTKQAPSVFYGSLSIGGASPFGSYAATQTQSDPYSETTYPAGYANGPAIVKYSADIEANLISGAGLMIRADYFKNSFDAQDVFINNSYAGMLIPVYNTYYAVRSETNNTTIQLNGNYYYTNFTLMGGIKKDFNFDHFSLGLFLVGGVIIVNTPNLPASIEINSTDSAGKQSTQNYKWQANSQTSSSFAFNLGFDAKIKFLPNVSCILKADFLCGLNGPGLYSTITQSNGVIITNPVLAIQAGVETFNVSIGIGGCF